RALYKGTVLLIRRALARQAVDPDRAERTIFWDPVFEVCAELEISQSKLSRLFKEFCGNSLAQVIDCVRVERIKKVLRAELKAFVNHGRHGIHGNGEGDDAPGASLGTGNGGGAAAGVGGADPSPPAPLPQGERGERLPGAVDKWAVWGALKE